MGMFLRTLHLHQFRSYREASFDFSPSINVICGPNAVGKTTLLEAIHFLMAGRSFRTSQIADLIHTKSAYFSLEATFIKQGIEQSLKVFYNGKERKVILNHTSYHSFIYLLGVFYGVCISPDDSALIKGAPVMRRAFLDLQLAQSDPLYVHKLTRFNRAMRQRNYLLRGKNLTTIESWEYEMAHAASYLILKRAAITHELCQKGSQIYEQLSADREKLSVIYKTAAPQGASEEELKNYYLEQFQKLRKKESELGYTLIGPHKDDLHLYLNDKEARYFASEGQQRSFVAALKLAEWDSLKAITGETPLMLIDDAGMGWDSFRKAKLFQYIEGLHQVFLTTTQEMPRGEGISSEKRTIRLA
ncbi:DNA replication/repair protein RecF [Parachlamydia sp. AcF125]|uniref:DNA replication/repair protein RecF n=1 Tax=Parachlamydia sp. AcF125 TaxID=2795736 RepID=UPI001BC9EC02|nr:DNA replication/repair protein RecF [Parachlamydia sp. AcF125]MBS4168883.1 DNA replication and repair protein RecF [Parachlamydia sp. AcF125]